MTLPYQPDPKSNSAATTTFARNYTEIGMIINPFTKEIRVLTDQDKQFQKQKRDEYIKLNEPEKRVDEDSSILATKAEQADLEDCRDQILSLPNHEEVQDDRVKKMHLLQMKIANMKITHSLNSTPAS